MHTLAAAPNATTAPAAIPTGPAAAIADFPSDVIEDTAEPKFIFFKLLRCVAIPSTLPVEKSLIIESIEVLISSNGFVTLEVSGCVLPMLLISSFAVLICSFNCFKAFSAPDNVSLKTEPKLLFFTSSERLDHCIFNSAICVLRLF